MSKLQWFYDRLRAQLWFRPAQWTAGAVAAALLAAAGDLLLPAAWVPGIDADTLNRLLDIVATSMLTVSIFSLSIVVSAFAAASSGATPRAVRLMTGDDDAQTPLAIFVAAFVYAVVAITALGSGYYGRAGQLVLFVATLLMLAFIIFVFLRWIHTISRLGRMGYTIERVELAARRALRRHRAAPLMGGMPLPSTARAGVALHLPRTGYLQMVDVPALQDLAKSIDVEVHVLVRPGTFVHPAAAVARVVGTRSPDAEQLHELASAFVVDRERTHEADPRYALIVLAEIAQRALSPAVNDPGTAIAVLGTLTRLLIDAQPEQPDAPDAGLEDGRATRVHVVALEVDALVTDAFDAIARDGAGLHEVGIRLLKSLEAVAANATPALATAAHAQIRRTIERARHLDIDPGDLQRLESLADSLAADHGARI